MIRLYVDESGVHDGSPVVSVAGYMARPTTWQRFTSEWRRILKPSGIEVFHSTDCNSFRGAFEGLDRVKRDKLVAQLLPIIPKYAFGHVVTIKLAEVEKALAERPELRKFCRDTYGMCLQWMLTTVVRGLDSLPNPRSVAVVHEVNDLRQSAIRAFDHVRSTEPGGRLLISLTFGSKAESVPLQAADILAFEASRRILYEDGPERRSLAALRAGERLTFKSFNRSNITLFVEMLEKIKNAYDSGILSDAWKYDR